MLAWSDRGAAPENRAAVPDPTEKLLEGWAQQSLNQRCGADSARFPRFRFLLFRLGRGDRALGVWLPRYFPDYHDIANPFLRTTTICPGIALK
jgi:hypothetical protein